MKLLVWPLRYTQFVSVVLKVNEDGRNMELTPNLHELHHVFLHNIDLL